MKAARFHGRGDIRVEEVPEPEVRPGTVLVEVEWCGICGTDLHEYSTARSSRRPPARRTR
jgi:(R,R)-butanediol dehydrogenase/meso-butanediol dehydrogenase/diacetyl reductase